MDYVAIIGYLAGGCTTIAVVPQIYKAWRTKTVRDVSTKMFAILTFGIFLWVIYGILKEDIPIIIANGISLSLNICMGITIIKFGNKTKE